MVDSEYLIDELESEIKQVEQEISLKWDQSPVGLNPEDEDSLLDEIRYGSDIEALSAKKEHFEKMIENIEANK
jgi:hypothetical protein